MSPQKWFFHSLQFLLQTKEEKYKICYKRNEKRTKQKFYEPSYKPCMWFTKLPSPSSPLPNDQKTTANGYKKNNFFFVSLYVFWFNSPLSASSILIRPENNIETVTKANTYWLWRFTIFCYVPNNDINDGASPDPFGFMSVPTFNVRD